MRSCGRRCVEPRRLFAGDARLNRSGQRDTVVVHRLVERGTVDERILDVLAERASLHDSVMAALRRP